MSAVEGFVWMLSQITLIWIAFSLTRIWFALEKKDSDDV